jgi:hypothetical protein
MDGYEFKFIVSENPTTCLASEFLDNEVKEKFGDKIILNWILLELKDVGQKELLEKDNKKGIHYQEIMIKNLEKFSTKLNSPFFEKASTYLKFNPISKKKIYHLIFKLIPLNTQNLSSRLNSSDSNIISLKYENQKWVKDKNLLWNPDFFKVVFLEQGILDIKEVN